MKANELIDLGIDWRCDKCLFSRKVKTSARNWWECRFDPPIFLGEEQGSGFPVISPGNQCGKFEKGNDFPDVNEGEK